MTSRVACFSIFLTLFFLTLSLSAQTKAPSRGPTTGPTNSNTTTQPNMGPMNTTPGQRAFVSGKVVLEDGSPIPEAASVQTICRGRKQTVAHTDSRGNFSFEFGNQASASAAGLADADVDSTWNPTRSSTGSQRDWRDCELVATLSGFTSQPVDLTSKMSTFETTDIGRLVLRRIGEVEGLTVSATSAMAPKDAQKAYEKGRNKASKEKWDEARELFDKAVQIYPKYAVAWYELGRLQLRKNDVESARNSFDQSIAADPKYVNPYRGLAQIDTQLNQWQPLVTVTDQLLALNPVSFPDAWFRNSLGHYYLRDLDGAEKSARQGMKVDDDHQFPKLEYLLGVILMQKRQYQEAALHVQNYLRVAKEPSEIEDAQKKLAEINRLSAAVQPPGNSDPAAPEKKPNKP
jgi:tetratricopeptide (TPR) repeat protein